MSKVIALQDTQLKGANSISGIYFSKHNSLGTNNASVISEGLNSGVNQPQVPQAPQTSIVSPSQPSQPVNMEDTPVNLNPNPVVNPGVTNQVFGSIPEGQAPSTEAVNVFQQPSGTANMFDIPSVPASPQQVQPEVVNIPQNNIFDTAPAPQTPVVEPTPSLTPEVSTQVNTGNEKVISISDLNSLRNKIDSFRDELHAEIDKIQEKLNKDSELNKASEVGQSAVDLIGPNNNLDETMVIPRDVMNSAIDEANQSMSLAA